MEDICCRIISPSDHFFAAYVSTPSGVNRYSSSQLHRISTEPEIQSRPDQTRTENIWITVENGRFDLNLNQDEVEKSTYQMYQEGIAQFNYEIESGRLSLEKEKTQSTSAVQSGTLTKQEQSTIEQNNQYVLQVAGDSGGTVGTTDGGVTAASCNRSGVTSRPYGGVIPSEIFVNIYLSEGNIKDINAAVGFGGITGPMLYDQLIKRGILSAGLLSGAAASAITVAVAAEWALIQIKANGCGVRIKTGYSPVNPTYQVPTVVSQG